MYGSFSFKKKKRGKCGSKKIYVEIINQGRLEIINEKNEGRIWKKKNGVDGPGIEMRGKEEWESAVGSSNGGCN